MVKEDCNEEADGGSQEASFEGPVRMNVDQQKGVQNVGLESQEQLEDSSGEGEEEMEDEEEEEWEEELEAGEKKDLKGAEKESERGDGVVKGRGKGVQEEEEESEEELSDEEGTEEEVDGAAEELEGEPKDRDRGGNDIEGGSDEEDEDTPLVFDADLPVDPLSLAEARDEPGHEFERYTKLQYEMLAERKRRAQVGGGPSEPPQKKQKTALYGASVDDIYGSKGELDKHFDKQEERRMGRRGLERKRGRRPGPRGLPAEVTRKLGQANLFYATEQYQEAVEVLVEVVRLAPNVADSYHTLGLCHETLGDRRKALNFYMIAAHLTPKDLSLWRRLAGWSTEQNNPAQAIYCLSKVIRWAPDDVDARWDRAVLMAEMGDFRKAGSEFEKLHADRPADAEVAKMLARMFHKLGQAQKATAVLESVIQRLPPGHVDLTAVNILAELHMEAGAFGAAVSAMTSARDKLGVALPPDLEVKLGICHAYLGDFEAAAAHTEPLRRTASEECADLFMDVGDAYAAVGRPHDALRFYGVLAKFAAFNQPALWFKMGQCHALVEDYGAAVEKLRRVLVELPDDLDARIALSDALLHLRRFDDGLRVLDAPPLALQSGTGTGTGTAPWWESARARMMRAKFQLAQGGTDAFLDAALPLVEETIEGEHQARQRRALEARQPTSKRGSDARNLDGQNPADVFAGYTPTQPRKKQKTRREKAAEKAAAEAAAQGGEEPGVNGPQGTAEGGGVNVPPTGDAASREEDALEEAADADVGREGEDDRADVSGEGGAADADVIGATPGSRGDEADGANALAEPPGAEPAVLIPDVFTSGESFELLFEVVKGLADTGRLKKAAGIVQRVMLLAKNAPPGKRLSGEQRRVLKQLTAGVEYTERPTGERERDTLRNKCKEEPDNMALWNELNEKATRSGGYLPYRKWLFQLRVKHPGSVPVAMLCGHQYASSQKHASALREYARAHAQLPDEPLISLSIGLAFLHHAMNRRTSHRNRAVLQGFAFLYKYHRLAGGSQEADFNLGRAYHQMGLVHLAVPYYEKALSAGLRAEKPGEPQADARAAAGEQGPEDADKEGEPSSDVREGGTGEQADASSHDKADVTKRAAHNLALIFQKSGAHLLADQIRRDYLAQEREAD